MSARGCALGICCMTRRKTSPPLLQQPPHAACRTTYARRVCCVRARVCRQSLKGVSGDVIVLEVRATPGMGSGGHASPPPLPHPIRLFPCLAHSTVRVLSKRTGSGVLRPGTIGGGVHGTLLARLECHEAFVPLGGCRDSSARSSCRCSGRSKRSLCSFLAVCGT